MLKPVICIGAVLIDELYFCEEPVIAATSNPASMRRVAGGVVANIARHLALLEIPVQFLTVLGNDTDGDWLKKEFISSGIDMSAAMQADCVTGKYAAILNPDGSLYTAACVNPAEGFLTPAFLEERRSLLMNASMIISDTNLTIDSLNWLNRFCEENNIKFVVEPVSIAKGRKLAKAQVNGLFMTTPNEDELPSLSLVQHSEFNSIIKELLARGINYIWLRKGEKGSSIYFADEQLSLHAAKVNVKDITGAGDAALAGWIAAHYWGLDELQCLKAGHTLAAEVIQLKGAIVHILTKKGCCRP